MLLPDLPASVARRCERPGALPDRALTQAEVERLWARDRTALVRCGWSLNALVAFYDDLKGRLEAADRGGR